MQPLNWPPVPTSASAADSLSRSAALFWSYSSSRRFLSTSTRLISASSCTANSCRDKGTPQWRSALWLFSGVCYRATSKVTPGHIRHRRVTELAWIRCDLISVSPPSCLETQPIKQTNTNRSFYYSNLHIMLISLHYFLQCSIMAVGGIIDLQIITRLHQAPPPQICFRY